MDLHVRLMSLQGLETGKLFQSSNLITIIHQQMDLLHTMTPLSQKKFLERLLKKCFL